MKQVGLDLLRHETDSYHKTGRVSPFTKLVEVTCIKTTCIKKGVKILAHYVRKDDLDSITLNFLEGGHFRMVGYSGFLPGIFSGEGKIYCYANFFCYANFSIVFGPNFRGRQKPPRGKTASGGCPLPPVEESQGMLKLLLFNNQSGAWYALPEIDL